MAPNRKNVLDGEEFLQLFKEGRQLFEAGKIKEATKPLEKAYKLSPGSEGVENLLGMVYFRLKDFPKAETIYKKLLKRNPHNLTLRLNLGLIFFKLEKYFDAIRELNDALSIKPNYDKAHNYLGLVYSELGKYKTAREEFLRAGSRSMAKKMEDIISGVSKPDIVNKKQEEKSKKADDEQPQEEIQVGDLTLDPELKEMLNDFENEKESEDSKGQTDSDVEHIHLDKSNEGLIEAVEVLDTIEDSHNEKPQEDDKPPSAKAKKERVDTDTDEADSKGKFTITSNNQLEIVFSGYTFARSNEIVTAEGNLNFENIKQSNQGKLTKDNLGGKENPIMKIKGEGKVLISPGDKRIFIIKIKANEVFYIRESSILAFQSGFSWENGSIKLTKDSNLDILQLKGIGSLATVSKTDPVTKQIVEGAPFKVRAGVIIGWQGKITPKVVQLAPNNDNSNAVDPPFIEFSGKGKVIIE